MGPCPRVFVSRDINDVNAIATRNAFLRGVLFDPRGNEEMDETGFPHGGRRCRALSKGA